MKVAKEFPPNYADIKTAFPEVENFKGCVFTYEDTLYNPHDTELRPDLVAHEAVHARQQGSDSEQWWKRYFDDPQFRLEQELEAYAVQYREAKKLLHGDKRKTLLTYLAMDLSGEGYGAMVDYQRAETLIRHAEAVL